MTGLDHKAEALRLDGDAYRTHAGPDVSVAYGMRALTHATLHLAEQQRIANLIAIYSAENADAFELMPAKATETFGPMFGQILFEIRDGLDLQ